ncbi:MAG: hypothetical protein HOC23_21170 [Halieaceae bacterium]|nr:hypothetical protein [Halieaceae bacterium]
MSYFEHIRMKVRFDHPLGVLLDALDKIGIKIVPYYFYLEGKSKAQFPTGIQAPENCTFSQLTEIDMHVIASIPERHISQEQLLDRLNQGKICFGVKYNGQLAGFTWVDPHECSYEGYRFVLKGHEAYLFDAFTLMPFRGKGLAPYMRYSVYSALEADGITTMYSISNYLHKSAVRFKEKLHAKIIDRGMHVSLFNTWNLSTKANRDRGSE